MSFSDWTQLVNSNATFGLDVTSPINGSGSLRFQRNSSIATNDSGWVHLDGGSFTLGMTKGRIRTLVEAVITGGPDPRTQRWGTGIVCMTETATANLLTVSNSLDFYGFHVHVESATGFTRWVIGKGGLSGGNTVNIAYYLWEQAADAAFLAVQTDASVTFGNDGDIVPIEFEWNLDISGLGGIRLTARKGNIGDTDFSNLTTILDVIDSSTPYTTSAGEGLAFADGESTGGGGTDSGFRADDTTVSELI